MYRHPDLQKGLIITAVNGSAASRLSTARVMGALQSRPVTLTLTDKMVDTEAALTTLVLRAAVKWKAFTRRGRRCAPLPHRLCAPALLWRSREGYAVDLIGVGDRNAGAARFSGRTRRRR